MKSSAIFSLPLMALSFWVTPAFAQNDDIFTGPRVGAVVGWDNFSAGDRESDSKDDIAYGGNAGYDYQMGNLLVGIETELAGSGVSATFHNVRAPSDQLALTLGRDIYVGARLGYVVMPRLMLYAKAGYTNLKVNTSYNANALGSTLREDDYTADGFRVGAGVEYAFSGGFFAKGEYRYSHYGQDIANYDVDVDRNQIMLGLGYRF